MTVTQLKASIDTTPPDIDAETPAGVLAQAEVALLAAADRVRQIRRRAGKAVTAVRQRGAVFLIAASENVIDALAKDGLVAVED